MTYMMYIPGLLSSDYDYILRPAGTGWFLRRLPGQLLASS